MNRERCRRCCVLDGACILCTEHAGFDHRGVWRACIQEIHWCITDYGPPIFEDQRLEAR